MRDSFKDGLLKYLLLHYITIETFQAPTDYWQQQRTVFVISLLGNFAPNVDGHPYFRVAQRRKTDANSAHMLKIPHCTQLLKTKG